jgi:hypothetical protein
MSAQHKPKRDEQELQKSPGEMQFVFIRFCILIQKEMNKNCRNSLEICNPCSFDFVFEYKKRWTRIAQILWKSVILVHSMLYSNTKRDEQELQKSKEFVQFLFIRCCIMRRLVLNATILTAVRSVQIKVWISQQVAVQDNLRTKGIEPNAHLPASKLFKVSELKNDR